MGEWKLYKAKITHIIIKEQMAPSKKSAAASTPSIDATTTTKEITAEPVTSVVDATVETTVVESEPDRYDLVIDELQNFVNKGKELINIVKTLKKENAKSLKQAGKKRKTAVDGAKRPASGITKPTLLSDALCNFLSLPVGSSMARTNVTKSINTYIRENDLQDKEDRRTIIPDAKLNGILSDIPADKKLSFFNMQSFIKHQFVKA